MSKNRILGSFLLFLVGCGFSVAGSNYNAIDVFHPESEGYQTQTTTVNGVEYFAVQENDVTYCQARDTSVPAPTHSYHTEGGVTTLSLSTEAAASHFVCDKYPGKKLNQDRLCQTTCNTCTCMYCYVVNDAIGGHVLVQLP